MKIRKFLWFIFFFSYVFVYSPIYYTDKKVHTKRRCKQKPDVKIG